MWIGPGEFLAICFLSVAFWLVPFIWAISLFKRKGYDSKWMWLAIVPILGLPVLCAAFFLPNRTYEAENRQDPIFRELPDLPARMREDFTYLISIFSLSIFGNPSQGKDETRTDSTDLDLSSPGTDPHLLAESENEWEEDREATDREDYPALAAAVATFIIHLPLILMLVIPLSAGILCWYSDPNQLPTKVFLCLFLGTIVSTAILGYWDMRRLVHLSSETHPQGNQPISPPFSSFLQILGFWFPGYALHFLARRKYGGRNLVLPALVSMTGFLVPTVGTWLNQPTLPQVDSPEVLAPLLKRLSDQPVFQNRKEELAKGSFSEPTEISFGEMEQKRVGRVFLLTQNSRITVHYAIEWNDRLKTKTFVSIIRFHEAK